jgi:hypothetical protein
VRKLLSGGFLTVCAIVDDKAMPAVAIAVWKPTREAGVRSCLSARERFREGSGERDP